MNVNINDAKGYNTKLLRIIREWNLYKLDSRNLRHQTNAVPDYE